MDYRMESRESNIIFVGNIPFDTTEEQLIDVLRQAGPVAEFRLVFDRDTGKQRGYGFCAYADSKIGASAVKNLNGTMVSGRPLKLDFADHDVVRRQFGTDGYSLNGGSSSGIQQDSHMDIANKKMGQGYQHHNYMGSSSQFQAQISQPQIGPDQILATVNALSDTQKTEFVAQFQAFAKKSPSMAKELLTESPGLALALHHTLRCLGLADDETLQKMVVVTSFSDRDMASPKNRTGSPASSDMQSTFIQQNTDVPPPPNMPLPVTSNQPNANLPQSSETHNEQVLLQLMTLTQNQLDQLPPEHRKQILELKQQLLKAQNDS